MEGGQGDSDLNEVLQAVDLSRLAEATEIGPVVDKTSSQITGLRILILFSAGLRDHAVYQRWLRQHEAHDAPRPEAR